MTPHGGHLYRCDACGMLVVSDERKRDGWRCACRRTAFPRPPWHWSQGEILGEISAPEAPGVLATDPEVRHVGTLADYLGCA